MKQNKYDDPHFFSAYEKMPRSMQGLEGAGEWYVLKGLMPSLLNKSILDLGCGFGWHCRYAREQGASSVVGVDISNQMLQKAREKTNDPFITYLNMAIEDIDFSACEFDVVISSLAFHYMKSFEETCKKIYAYLKPGGTFLFSVEHPIFTARSEQNWYFNAEGEKLHWPVDHYQTEGKRDTTFLTDHVIKYHRTFSTYMNSLISAGFRIKAVEEPVPSDEMLSNIPEMEHEKRRPMFMIILAEKDDV